MPRRPTTLFVVGLAAVALSGCTAKHGTSAPSATRIGVSVNQCGGGWSDPHAGQQHFVLANTDTRAGEVLLTDARTAAVFADVEPIGPGTTTTLDIDLGSGAYAFRCAMEDESTVVGPTVTIPGSVKQPVAPVPALAQADLIPATKAYEAYVAGRIPTLAALTTALSDAVARGDLAAARTEWLPAHLEYERLGAAYGAFGDLDGEINGRPDGLPQGVGDPDWTGFHRVEYGLWHGEAATSLAESADALSASVGKLAGSFADAQIDPLELSIRAHEITENALQFELTGQSDYGSGSTLATVAANLDGTATVLGIIRPLLENRYSQLPALTSALAAAQADLNALPVAGAWPTLAQLSRTQHERVDADISELSEQLAPVASILEPRRPS